MTSKEKQDKQEASPEDKDGFCFFSHSVWVGLWILWPLLVSSVFIAMRRNGFLDAFELREIDVIVVPTLLIIFALSVYSYFFYSTTSSLSASKLIYGVIWLLWLFLFILYCVRLGQWHVDMKPLTMTSPPKSNYEEKIQTYMLSIFDSCCLESTEFELICNETEPVFPCTANQELFEEFQSQTGNAESRICEWMDTVKTGTGEFDSDGYEVKDTIDRFCSQGPKRYTSRILLFFKNVILVHTIFSFLFCLVGLFVSARILL